MPEWLSFNLEDPLTQKIVYAAIGLIALLFFWRTWRKYQERRAYARRRAELQRTFGAVQMKQQEIRDLAQRIIATSSTATIAGFEIVRQIEAVFTDGHRSQAEAVETLKALAAQKGANAVVNLGSARLPSGKCVANGDAVVVRPKNPLSVTSGPP